MFREPQALSLYEVAHSAEEDRWMTIGVDPSCRGLVVAQSVHPVDTASCRTRRLSARRTTVHAPRPSQGRQACNQKRMVQEESGANAYPAAVALEIPVYLDPEVAIWVRNIAAQIPTGVGDTRSWIGSEVGNAKQSRENGPTATIYWQRLKWAQMDQHVEEIRVGRFV